MAGSVSRDPVGDHLMTPQNAALFLIDYQPSQIVPQSTRWIVTCCSRTSSRR
jgi:hypothetical protein